MEAPIAGRIPLDVDTREHEAMRSSAQSVA
jgi:hypothetical protein